MNTAAPPQRIVCNQTASFYPPNKPSLFADQKWWIGAKWKENFSSPLPSPPSAVENNMGGLRACQKATCERTRYTFWQNSNISKSLVLVCLRVAVRHFNQSIYLILNILTKTELLETLKFCQKMYLHIQHSPAKNCMCRCIGYGTMVCMPGRWWELQRDLIYRKNLPLTAFDEWIRSFGFVGRDQWIAEK